MKNINELKCKTKNIGAKFEFHVYLMLLFMLFFFCLLIFSFAPFLMFTNRRLEEVGGKEVILSLQKFAEQRGDFYLCWRQWEGCWLTIKSSDSPTKIQSQLYKQRINIFLKYMFHDIRQRLSLNVIFCLSHTKPLQLLERFCLLSSVHYASNLLIVFLHGLKYKCFLNSIF